MIEDVTFTVAGALAGARRTLPLAVSTFAFGVVFGLLARRAEISLLESVLMSGLVFAGSAQFVVLELWKAPLPVTAILLTTLVVNLRYLLLGAALRPWFSRLPALKAYTSVFLMADENWAMTMREFGAGGRDGAFLLGGGLAVFAGWVSGTVIGQTVGGAIQDPAKLGLDFAFTAVFTALLVGMWKGKSSLLPWAVAAGVAVVAAQLLPGQWYILLGGLAGSLTGAWLAD